MFNINEIDIKTINDNASAAISRILREIKFVESMLNENDYDAARDVKLMIGNLVSLKTKIFAESESKISEYRENESKNKGK